MSEQPNAQQEKSSGDLAKDPIDDARVKLPATVVDIVRIRVRSS